MNVNGQVTNNNVSLQSEIFQMSGEKIQNCYQCQKCSAGCPLNFAMDTLPNQIFRHVQYGHRDKVLSSNTIWICASCHTCSTRCPNSIDIARIMDTLRNISNRSGAVSGDRKISLFHKVFLAVTKYFGRTWEPGMGLYIMQTGGLGGMMGWTMKMFRKGRIGIFPTFKGGREYRRLFKNLGKGGSK
ncbi:MAG TPA: 4Fe-4S dicluster domain-containing protein [Acidobacteriota bacterium]|nr:4Fe-4S dicluster domain-containing protein [Acidobacteriota bacterium]